MKKFLIVMSIVWLVVMLVCAILYWTNGVYQPISSCALIFFILSVTGIYNGKKKK